MRQPRREGTERVQVGEDATEGELREAIESQLGIPQANQVMSLDQGLVRSHTDFRLVTMLLS